MNYIQLRATNYVDKLMGVKYAGLGGVVGKLWSGTGGKLLNWVGNKVTGAANKGFQRWMPGVANRVTPGIGSRMGEGIGSRVAPGMEGRVMGSAGPRMGMPGTNSNFYSYTQRGLNWMGKHPQAVGGMTLGGAYAGYRGLSNSGQQPQQIQIPMPTSRPGGPQMGVPQYPNYY
jgi:hypothetical protein